MQNVSVVIPALNNADTINETLISCLAEPEVGEAIVVLAPSTDKSASAVLATKDCRVQLVEPGVKGIAQQMNIGLLHATLKYFCKIDADDTVIRGRFAAQTSFLDAHEDYVAIAGGLVSIDNDGTQLTEARISMAPGDVTALYLAGREVAHLGTHLIRTEALRSIGGFRHWFFMSEDYDTSFRLAEAGKIWLSPDPAYCFRIRPSSITHSEPKRLSEFYAEAARCFARQRIERSSDDLQEGCPPSLPDPIGTAESMPFDPRTRASNFLETGAWQKFEQGNYSTALSQMLHAIQRSPPHLRRRRLRNLAVMVAKALLSPFRNRA